MSKFQHSSADLPSGLITTMFTDIVNSTKLKSMMEGETDCSPGAGTRRKLGILQWDFRNFDTSQDSDGKNCFTVITTHKDENFGRNESWRRSTISAIHTVAARTVRSTKSLFQIFPVDVHQA
jgi:hypothetical protein